MVTGLRRLFGKRPDAILRRPRLQLSDWPAAVYAFGDVHGCAAQLQRLHDAIFADAEAIGGKKLIVGLGDYVDRGIDSAGVLEFLASPLPPGFDRICLAGNHEVMMLGHIADPRSRDQWLDIGGIETLASYGIDPSRYLAAAAKERASLLQRNVPARHLTFLRELPLTLALRGAIFVHAGLRPGVALADQDEDDLLWLREPYQYDTGSEDPPFVVHGHTPAPQPAINGRNIGIDTGAFATGVLTAIRLRQGHEPMFLNVGASERA